MVVEAFEPRLNDSHRFAVTLPYGNGDGRIIGVSPNGTDMLKGGKYSDQLKSKD